MRPLDAQQSIWTSRRYGVAIVCRDVCLHSMVDKFEIVVTNLNQLYMTATMAAPMVLIEVLVMWAMYQNRALNFAIIAAALVATAALSS
jgi:hypothetical protein